MKTKIFCAIGLLSVLLFIGCSKTDQKRSGTLKVQIDHTVDGKAILWDSLHYRNEAGNIYAVQKLQYYLGDIRFYGHGKLVRYIDTVIFVDAKADGKDAFALYDFPYEYVDSISFLIGVTSKYNTPGGLPATMDNTNMGWPEMMGGGYHFLKLEGSWLDGTQTQGFTVHIGKEGFQAQASARCSYQHRETGIGPLVMTMNVNEWFRNPHVYNFATDGVYSMGNEVLMRKLMENGKDVFMHH